LNIDRFLSGLITRRSQLIPPLKALGSPINLVKFFDALTEPSVNIECSDNLTLQRRPGFSTYCSQQLLPNETVNQFYSVRRLDGSITVLLDTNLALYTMTPTALTQIFAKTIPDQFFIQQVGDVTFATNGTDIFKWDGTRLSSWGVAAPTVAPVLQQLGKPGFWIKSTNYFTGQALLDSNGNVEYCVQGGLSALVVPIWPTVVGGKVFDGNAQWEMVGGIGRWIPGTIYTLPSVVLDSNNNLQLITAISGTGTSGTTVPVWSTTFAATTSDSGGLITWTNIGPGIVIAYSGYSYLSAYRTIDGNLSTASPVSAQTGAILGSVPISPVNITSYSISSGIGTFAANNNLEPQSQMILNGFTNSTFLNGQPVTVFSANATSFTASVVGPNTGVTPEAGQGNPAICIVNGVPSTNPDCNSVSTIVSVSVAGNVVTFGGANNFSVGLSIGISGLINATFMNGQTVVVSEATPTSWKANFLGPNGAGIPDYPATPDNGTATFLACEVYRPADGGGLWFLAGAALNAATGTSPSVPYTDGALANFGADDGAPGAHPWLNPANVSSASAYSTVSLTPAVGSGGAFSFVQSAHYSPVSLGASQQSITFSLPNPVVVGNTVVLSFDAFDYTNAGYAVVVSDNLGNTWTQDNTQFFPGAHHEHFYHAQITTGGTMHITIHPSTSYNSNSFIVAAAGEVAGLAQSLVTDGINGAEGTQSGNSFSSGSVTTTNAADVIFTSAWSGAGSLTVPAGFTAVDIAAASGVGHFGMAYKQVTSAGTQSPTWFTTSPQFIGIGSTVAFKLNSYAPSDGLRATQFPLLVPASIGISGVQMSFEALYNGAAGQGTLTVQLLKNGTPVGVPKTVTPTGTASPPTSPVYTLGGPADLWGTTFTPADLSNPNYGFSVTANLFPQSGGPFTFSIRNVNTEVFGSTGGSATSLFTFYDTVPDAGLDNFLIAPTGHINDSVPGTVGSTQPLGGTIMAWWQGRIWLVVGHFLYFSGGPDILNGIPESCWPPANTFVFPGEITGLAATTKGLLVFTHDALYAIQGGPQTLSFYPEPLLENFGISSPNCLKQDGDQIYCYTTSKQYFSLSMSGKEEDGQRIGNLLSGTLSPILGFPPATSYLAMHRNGEDAGVFLSNGNNAIMRYGLNTQNWSTKYQPVLPASQVSPTVASASGTFTAGASPNTTNHDTLSISCGFQPKAVYFWTVGGIASGLNLGPAPEMNSFGAATPIGLVTSVDAAVSNLTTYHGNFSPIPAAGSFVNIQGFRLSGGANNSRISGPAESGAGGTAYLVTAATATSITVVNSRGVAETAAPVALTAVSAITSATITYAGAFASGNLPISGNFVTIAGFANPANNGTFMIYSGSNTTSLIVMNNGVSGVLETHAATATPVCSVIGQWSCAAGMQTAFGAQSYGACLNDRVTLCQGNRNPDNSGSYAVAIFNPDGFTLARDFSGSNLLPPQIGAYQIQWMALGGEGIQNAVAGTMSMSGSGAVPQSVGFLPTCVIGATIGKSDAADNGSGTFRYAGSDWSLSVGICDASLNQGVVAAWANSNQNNTPFTCFTGSYNQPNQFYACDAHYNQFPTTNLLRNSGKVTSMDASNNGQFVVTPVLSGGDTFALGYCAMQVIDAKVGNFQTPTATGPFSTTGLGFTPFAGFVLSGLKPTSAVNTLTQNGSMSIGGFFGTSQGVSAVNANSNLLSPTTSGAMYADAVYANVGVAPVLGGIPPLLGKISVASLDADGFTMNASVPDPTPNTAYYLMLGPSPDAPPVPKSGPIASVETSPGVYSLLTSSTVPGDTVKFRDLTSFTDAGTPYPASVVVGSITVSEPGQALEPVHSITGYFAQAGNIPAVSVLWNEIFATSTSVFVPLLNPTNEPPLGTDPSLSLMQKKWPTMNNVAKKSQLAHHVQIKVDFGSDAVMNEILALVLRFENENG
jgi:hypothetical protein